MVVALADSFFFDVDLDGTRTRLLGFLLVSFTPFLIVAPMIGPMIDRVRGGRRLVIRMTALARLIIQVTMIWFTDDLWLFPLVFVALVLQKTYAVSKSAIVPSVVRNEAELVEANSKLGLIAGLVGAVAVVPAAGLQFVVGSGPTLAYGAVLFALALWWSIGLPASSGPADETAALGGLDDIEAGDLRTAWVAMLVLRAAAGFTLFHLALWYRGTGAESWWLGAAVGAGSLGTMFGNAIAQTMRRLVAERNMLATALVLDSPRRARRHHDRRGTRRGGPRRHGQSVGGDRPTRLREHRSTRRTRDRPRTNLRALREPVPIRMGGRRDPSRAAVGIRNRRIRVPSGRGWSGGCRVRLRLRRRHSPVTRASHNPGAPISFGVGSGSAWESSNSTASSPARSTMPCTKFFPAET